MSSYCSVHFSNFISLSKFESGLKTIFFISLVNDKTYLQFPCPPANLLPLCLQADQAALQLGGSAQNVVASMAKLTSAAAQGNESYTGREARATAAALGDFTRSVRSVAATTTDRAMQTK